MDANQQQLYPSFRAIYGREPIAGHDYDPEKGMCQDDHDFFAGIGQYSDDVKPVQRVVYSAGNPSSLKAAVSDCWGRGHTDAVADGKDVLVNRGTWRIEGCSVEEFNILCAEIESEQSRELDLPGQAEGVVNTAVLTNTAEELSASGWAGQDLGAEIEGVDL
jgi:hypothetical protein